MSWCSICKIYKWWWNSRKFLLLPEKNACNKQNPSVFHILSLYIETESLSWRNHVGGRADGDPSVVGSVTGLNIQKFGGLAGREFTTGVWAEMRVARGLSRKQSARFVENFEGEEWSEMSLPRRQRSLHGPGEEVSGRSGKGCFDFKWQDSWEVSFAKEILTHFQCCLGLCERKDISIPKISA